MTNTILQQDEAINITLGFISSRNFSKATKSLEQIETKWYAILSTLICLETKYNKCEFLQLGFLFKKQPLEVSYTLFMKQLDTFDSLNRNAFINQLRQFAELRVFLILIYKAFAEQRMPSPCESFVEFVQDTEHIQSNSDLMRSIKLEADIIDNFIQANDGLKDYNIQSSSVNLYLAANSFSLFKSTIELPLQIFIGKLLETLGEKMRLMFNVTRKADEPEIQSERYLQAYIKGYCGLQVNLMYLTDNLPFNVNGYSCNKKEVESGLLNYPCVYTYPPTSNSAAHWASVVSIVQSDEYQCHNSTLPDNCTTASSTILDQGWSLSQYNPFALVKTQAKPYYSFYDSKMNTTYSIGSVSENVLLVSIADHLFVSRSECGEIERPSPLPGFTRLLKHFKNVFHYTKVFDTLK